MSIFRRGKKAEDTDPTDEVPQADVGADPAEDLTDGEAAASETAGADEQRPADAAPQSAPLDRTAGPFDASEVDSSEGRLDLGSLWVAGVPGMQLRLEIEEEGQQVVGVTALLEESAVQLQAFAAPRSYGIWDEIRTEIADSVVSQGGTVEEGRGPLGTELRTRMPSAGPDGRTVFAPARFVGVDGPRWFLRAVFSGRAALEEGAAEPLLEVVRGTVVVRGDQAMAPRELLPLAMPLDAADAPSLDDADADADDDTDGTGDTERTAIRSTDDLKPFERGPEITEIR